MLGKHKILYVMDFCDYIVDPPQFIFIESFLSLMSTSEAVKVSNNVLSYKRLIRVFNEQFSELFNTCLEAGHPEPVYIPSTLTMPARVCFRADYASSALHEVAHWCIAGPERREKTDYGYWYEPDGRSQDQQKEFEQVEVKPQAVEWLFSIAAGIRFRISTDNIEASTENGIDCGIEKSGEFEKSVALQAKEYLMYGLPERAQIYYDVLLEQGCGRAARENDFSADALIA